MNFNPQTAAKTGPPSKGGAVFKPWSGPVVKASKPTPIKNKSGKVWATRQTFTLNPFFVGHEQPGSAGFGKNGKIGTIVKPVARGVPIRYIGPGGGRPIFFPTKPLPRGLSGTGKRVAVPVVTKAPPGSHAGIFFPTKPKTPASLGSLGTGVVHAGSHAFTGPVTGGPGGTSATQPGASSMFAGVTGTELVGLGIVALALVFIFDRGVL